MKVLLSIKPEFAEEIFEGNKKYEYRRVIFKREDVKKVIVYATAPVSMVVGEFEIEGILHKDIKNLWAETKNFSGISEEFFFNYFNDKDSGYAIKVMNYIRYNTPQNLKANYGVLPPQSFVYVS